MGAFVFVILYDNDEFYKDGVKVWMSRPNILGMMAN